MAERVLKKFEKAGLMRYMTHDYRTIHDLDFTEWFAHAKVTKGKIESRFNEIDITTSVEALSVDIHAVDGAEGDVESVAEPREEVVQEIDVPAAEDQDFVVAADDQGTVGKGIAAEETEGEPEEDPELDAQFREDIRRFPIAMEMPSPFLLPQDTASTFAARMVDRERWSAPVAPEIIDIPDSPEHTEVQENEQREQYAENPAGSRVGVQEGGNREAPIDEPTTPADDLVTSTGSRAAIPLSQVDESALDDQVAASRDDTASTFAARMVERERWNAPVAPEIIDIPDSPEQTEVQTNEQREQTDGNPAGSFEESFIYSIGNLCCKMVRSSLGVLLAILAAASEVGRTTLGSANHDLKFYFFGLRG
ncbi:uncharacterized protein LOC115995851 [Ipomoea triloba]|uniref:uncharacterized protein LOC115995851 n=1 Tax=Ipomoea triloba TaxID=35885 RepID=UPI00125DF454|nr:uncharacterized protein LOC115995851 [Ipomoea triloba]